MSAESKAGEENPLDPAKVLQVTNKLDPLQVVKVNAFAMGITRIADLQRFANLTVLSLSSNSINDISGLRFSFSLVELYLRKNNISDLRQIGYLQNLNNLNVLFLADNPCSQADQYRNKVLRCLKFLSTLDVTVATDDDKASVLNTKDTSVLSFEESVKKFIENSSNSGEAEAKDIGTTVLFRGLQSAKSEGAASECSGFNLPPVMDVMETSEPNDNRPARRGSILEAIKILITELQSSDILLLRQICDDRLAAVPPQCDIRK